MLPFTESRAHSFTVHSQLAPSKNHVDRISRPPVMDQMELGCVICAVRRRRVEMGSCDGHPVGDVDVRIVS